MSLLLISGYIFLTIKIIFALCVSDEISSSLRLEVDTNMATMQSVYDALTKCVIFSRSYSQQRLPRPTMLICING